MEFSALYQRESETGWKIKKWEDANELLSYLKASGPSAMSFTLENSSYVQCAGSLTRLTVEVRFVNEDETYTHYVVGKGPLTGRTENIECSVGPIKVDSSQVLKMRDARRIIREFVESRIICSDYRAEKVNYL